MNGMSIEIRPGVQRPCRRRHINQFILSVSSRLERWETLRVAAGMNQAVCAGRRFHILAIFPHTEENGKVPTQSPVLTGRNTWDLPNSPRTQSVTYRRAVSEVFRRSSDIYAPRGLVHEPAVRDELSF
jgi:hypothetical protein